jgi:hypothetical protein
MSRWTWVAAIIIATVFLEAVVGGVVYFLTKTLSGALVGFNSVAAMFCIFCGAHAFKREVTVEQQKRCIAFTVLIAAGAVLAENIFVLAIGSAGSSTKTLIAVTLFLIVLAAQGVEKTGPPLVADGDGE